MEERDLILRGGPWIVAQRNLMLKPWAPEFYAQEEKVCKVPVWVHLLGLDVQYWSIKGLSKIGSKVGKPIFVDRCTASKARISYACILIEVDVSSDLPHIIHLCTPFGIKITR